MSDKISSPVSWLETGFDETISKPDGYRNIFGVASTPYTQRFHPAVQPLVYFRDQEPNHVLDLVPMWINEGWDVE